MLIIETVSEFNQFLNRSKSSNWILVPTYCNGEFPVYIDRLSLLYIKVLDSKEEVIVVFDHTEGLNLPVSLIDTFPTETKLFVFGKKRFLQFYSKRNLIDASMIKYFKCNQNIEDDFETTAHEFFTRTFGKFSNLNTIIPISKHIEKGHDIVNEIETVLEDFQDTESFEKYNDLILNTLFQIEKNGLFTNYELFKKKFPQSVEHDNFVYSEYNVYTTTGRPSNRFGGINFAALNKENGSRTAFVSRFGENGFMMSFDYDAYHLRLLAELIDYEFPKNCSVHRYLGTFYFQKEELTEEEYLEAKSISFRQLYGGIAPEYLTIPFFAKVNEYTQLLWERYREDGFIETPMFSRKLHSSFFTEMNAAKLLNYLLQSFETERNIAVIHNILQRTQSFSSRLILYTYDSFLFDFHRKDGAEFIKLIKSELEQNGKFPITLEVGPDYSNMVKKTI